MRLLLFFLLTCLLLASCQTATVTPLPSALPPTPVETGGPPVSTAATTVPVTPSPTTVPATATPPPTSTPSPSPTPKPAVTLAQNENYAFPVAGNQDLMTWTHYHWDGSNAVDVEATRHLSEDSEEFVAFGQLPVVAVTSGTVTIADNPAGGMALLLYGDDGYAYYYGHLSEQWIEDGQTVAVGDELGRIGNTGRWTQYIEPHLHFSIATHESDNWRWQPDINAAERFLTWFDLPWQDLNISEYPADQATGWPVAVPAQVVRSFAERQALNPDQGSIDIAPLADEQQPLPVYATLGGEVNVNRATVMGLRVQITNRPARTTVVYSFLLKSTVIDGDVVRRGDVVGYADPLLGLNYMLFVRDVQTDPQPTLELGP